MRVRANTDHKESMLRKAIIVLLLANFIISAGYRPVMSIISPTVAVPAISITSEHKSYPTTSYLKIGNDPAYELGYSLYDFFRFYLPFTLLGIYLVPFYWLAVFQAEQSFYLAHILPHIILWFAALVSIPIIIRYSLGIPKLRRILYIYLIAALISGMAAEVWSTILQP